MPSSAVVASTRTLPPRGPPCQVRNVGPRSPRQRSPRLACSEPVTGSSSTETFGNVTLEAMASALPVVAARATGSLSLVADGVNGILTSPDDIDGSADAIAFYVGDRDARLAAGEAGYKAAQRYDWDRINQGLLDRYLHVAQVGRRLKKSPWWRRTSRRS